MFPLYVTVDVEDWPQSTLDASLPITPRAESNARRLLETLAEQRVHATLFVLATIAKLFPALVRDAHAAGHEIASHGCGHIPIFRQTQGDFREDVTRAKDVLEQCIGEAVLGYRAPDFSIVTSTLWALAILAEQGYTYDSSVFPLRTRRYGIAGWPSTPADVRLSDGRTIVELPIGVWRRGALRLPVGGGGYHRLLPGIFARHLIRQALREAPFVFYCHPYETDPDEFDQLDIHVPWKVRLHQGIGRSHFDARLHALFAEFGGCPAREALRAPRTATVALPGSATPAQPKAVEPKPAQPKPAQPHN
ncbi:MAG: polysaccharide deacetylase family protein [Longimicrobiales bacterium]